MDIRNFRVLLRTFERLLIKERRKPRFPTVGARLQFSSAKLTLFIYIARTIYFVFFCPCNIFIKYISFYAKNIILYNISAFFMRFLRVFSPKLKKNNQYCCILRNFYYFCKQNYKHVAFSLKPNKLKASAT